MDSYMDGCSVTAPERADLRDENVLKKEAELRELKIRHMLHKDAPTRELVEFFGSASEQCFTRTLTINVADLLMYQRALHALLPGWRIEREVQYLQHRTGSPKRVAVEVAPDQFDFLIEVGRQFWRGPANERMTIDVWIDDDIRAEESELTFTLAANRHEWFNALLPQMRQWADKNHFLHNQAITLKGEFLRFEKPTTLDDVILLPEVRDALERNCIGMLRYADLYRANNIPLKRGIVLHGPPGTGKTSIGRALAQQCKVTFLMCTAGMLEEAKHVRAAFKLARRLSPCILFFEDLDMVAGSRHGGHRNDLLGEFLAGLDGLDTAEGVITIATTNDIRTIEGALKDRPNRFDCVLEIGPLPYPQRMQFLQLWRATMGSDNHTFDTEKMARKTEKFTGAQLQELCRLAVFEAVEDRVNECNFTPEQVPLSQEHFARALKRMGQAKKRPAGFMADEDEE